MRAALASLVLIACVDTHAETITAPAAAVFGNLISRAPWARVKPPITLDTASCAFALYVASDNDDTFSPRPFVLIHPSRTRCELWLGDRAPTEYCLFEREDLVLIEVHDDRPQVIVERPPCVGTRR